MNARLQRILLRLTVIVVGSASAHNTRSVAADVSIVVDRTLAPPARHGLDRLESSLREKGSMLNRTNSLDDPLGDLVVVAGVATQQGPAAELLQSGGVALPTGSEALVIQSGGGETSRQSCCADRTRAGSCTRRSTLRTVYAGATSQKIR